MLTDEYLTERKQSEGWTHRGDIATEGEVLELLYGLVRCLKPEVAVETGTYHGHGTEALSAALIANEKGHLWTVERDPFVYQPRERTTYVTADSLEWARDQAPVNIDFAFIDCGLEDHRVEVASALRWKMAANGVIAVHDTVYYEPKFLNDLTDVLGPPSLQLPTLCGVAIWKYDQPH